MKNVKFAGHLYQLSSKSKLGAGQYVAVNGPWDTFGTVVKSEPEADGRHLNLIRGCKAQPGTRPVVAF